MRILVISVLAMLAANPLVAQDSLSLTECYRLAEQNYPLVRDRSLIAQRSRLSLESIVSGRLPQAGIGGKATYQSDVTRIPVELPGVDPLSKDQYQFYGEVSQVLYDGGVIAARKRAEETRGDVDLRTLEVDLYAIRERINDLYFGILLMQEQHRQNALVKHELSVALETINASIANGVALQSEADVLRAEILRVQQRMIANLTGEEAYRDMLSVLIGQRLKPEVLLERPVFVYSGEVLRPELDVFGANRRRIEAERALLSARLRPQLEFFVQGGYGRPALNMLENSFAFYYLGGLRFSWRISGYYTARRENQILTLREASIDAREDAFLLNTRLAMRQEESEIKKYNSLIAVDREIIELRTKVQETASVKLREGVISSTDFVREVNATDQARQQLALHEIQLLMAQARYHFTTGI